MGSEEGAKSGIHLAILTFITVLTHPDFWHAIQNGDPYIIKDHIIITLLQFFVCFISMQHRILTFTSLNHFSPLVRGWKNRGVGRAFRWKPKIHLECAYQRVEKRLVWDWQDTHFRGLGSLGPKSEFLIHQATLSCYPGV